jgi:integrase
LASIIKTPSGTWKAIIRRANWPTVIKTFRIKRDAENWARTTEDEIIRGIYVPRAQSEKMKLSDAIDRYLKEVTPTKKPTTQRAEIFRAEQIRSKLGKYSLASLSSNVIGKYRDERLGEGKSNSTVRLELALLGHLYNVAIKEWQVGMLINPVQNIRKPAPDKGRDRRLVANEEERLLKACDEHSNPLLGWIVRLALYTAMRRGEIINLTRADIDMKKRTVYLADTKNDESRTVPLTNKAHETLNEVLKFSVRPEGTDLLFFGEAGKDGKRRPYVLDSVWRSALVRAEISNLRFHDLRHEATSRFIEADLSDQQVASITGHKSMQMLKRYTHLRSEDLVDKISLI